MAPEKRSKPRSNAKPTAKGIARKSGKTKSTISSAKPSGRVKPRIKKDLSANDGGKKSTKTKNSNNKFDARSTPSGRSGRSGRLGHAGGAGNAGRPVTLKSKIKRNFADGRKGSRVHDDDDEMKIYDESINTLESSGKPRRKRLVRDIADAVEQSRSLDQLLQRKHSATELAPRGVVFVSRIPHGFYEREMRSYFGQFGKISRLRISRNKKTGHSKHYAFIEFESKEVAKIVADTMNNYLVKGHLLKCGVIEDPHENLFDGADKPFRAVPKHVRVAKSLEKAKRPDSAEKTAKRRLQRLRQKNNALKSLGIKYSYDL